MKIRIQDNSVRFRITVRELETLVETGDLVARTSFPGGKSEFRYGLRVAPPAGPSQITFQDNAIIATLSSEDLAQLRDPAREGVYIQDESAPDAASSPKRFIFFVEKDRPGSACEKPEQWIYEETAGKPISLREIGK
jgi:hypothetical protein